MELLGLLCVWTFYHPLPAFAAFALAAGAVFYAIHKAGALV